MNPVDNPFAPGAGTPPPELAGRDELRESVRVALERARRGLHAKSLLMVGLRGVGKTVLLDRIRDDAEALGVHTVRIEAPEGRSLPAMLAPQLRQALLRLGANVKARDLAQRGLRALAGFAKSLKIKYGDIEVGIDVDPEPGLADNGDLEHDLSALFEQVGLAAQRADTALAVLLDEMQYVQEPELAALITAMHRCAQRRLPVVLIGAGLPPLRGRMGNAKSYAERLFDFPEVGALEDADARSAIVKPLEAAGVSIEEPAVRRVIQATHGYPYFVQEWGKHTWDVAKASPIRKSDVLTASKQAVAALDESFFRVRFDRLTPAEKRYLRAMAQLGPGPHRSGSIADCLGVKVTSLGPTRNALIPKA